VTDVTTNFLTVTIRESSTDQGFFKDKRWFPLILILFSSVNLVPNYFESPYFIVSFISQIFLCNV
jgi:hypothetical protein